MRKLVVLSFVLLNVMISCGDDDGGDDQGNVIANNTFTLVVDGEEITISQMFAQRSEDKFNVIALGPNGEGFEIPFHKDGNFGIVDFLSGTTNTNGFSLDYSTPYFFPGDVFEYNLLEINESATTVAGSFSGTLYEDEFDTTSPGISVSGAFNLPYTVVAPQIAGLEVSAMINGEKWVGTRSSTTGGAAGSTIITLFSLNDTAYEIGLVIGNSNLAVGDFAFNSTTDVYKMEFIKYASASDTDPIVYETEGNLSITNTVPGQISIVEATFSFVATNPDTNEEITVTSGVFKDAFFN